MVVLRAGRAAPYQAISELRFAPPLAVRSPADRLFGSKASTLQARPVPQTDHLDGKTPQPKRY